MQLKRRLLFGGIAVGAAFALAFLSQFTWGMAETLARSLEADPWFPGICLFALMSFVSGFLLAPLWCQRGWRRLLAFWLSPGLFFGSLLLLIGLFKGGSDGLAEILLSGAIILVATPVLIAIFGWFDPGLLLVWAVAAGLCRNLGLKYQEEDHGRPLPPLALGVAYRGWRIRRGLGRARKRGTHPAGSGQSDGPEKADGPEKG